MGHWVSRVTAIGCAWIALAGCGGDARHPLARTYEQQAQLACPCFAAEMGFSSEQACREGYLAQYVGTDDDALVCLDMLVAEGVQDLVRASQCWEAAEEDFLLCLSDLTCDSAEHFRRCEQDLYSALGGCPQVSYQADGRWSECIRERQR